MSLAVYVACRACVPGSWCFLSVSVFGYRDVCTYCVVRECVYMRECVYVCFVRMQCMFVCVCVCVCVCARARVWKLLMCLHAELVVRVFV